MIINMKQKKTKIEPRIKLNYNIYTVENTPYVLIPLRRCSDQSFMAQTNAQFICYLKAGVIGLKTTCLGVPNRYPFIDLPCLIKRPLKIPGSINHKGKQENKGTEIREV